MFDGGLRGRSNQPRDQRNCGGPGLASAGNGRRAIPRRDAESGTGQGSHPPGTAPSGDRVQAASQANVGIRPRRGHRCPRRRRRRRPGDRLAPGAERSGRSHHHDHHPPGDARRLLPVARHPGTGRRRARPAGARHQDRELHRRPPVGRAQPGRHRLRGTGRGGDHPVGGRLPVPLGIVGRRPALGPRTRRRHPLAVVEPRLRARRRHRSRVGAPFRRAAHRQEHPRRPVRISHYRRAGPGGALFDLREHGGGMGAGSVRRHAARSHLRLQRCSPGRGGARLRRVGAHPVLVLVRRHLAVEPEDGRLSPFLFRGTRHPHRRDADGGYEHRRHVGRDLHRRLGRERRRRAWRWWSQIPGPGRCSCCGTARPYPGPGAARPKRNRPRSRRRPARLSPWLPATPGSSSCPTASPSPRHRCRHQRRHPRPGHGRARTAAERPTSQDGRPGRPATR